MAFVILCVLLHSLKLQEHIHHLIQLFYGNQNCTVIFAGFIAFKLRSVNGMQANNKDILRHISTAWQDNCFDLEKCYPEILKMTLGFKLSSYLKYSSIQQFKSITEAVTRRCVLKKRFQNISKNLRENTCVCIFFKKETPPPLFSFEFWALFCNNFFVEPQ